jgi:hypothetical protein
MNYFLAFVIFIIILFLYIHIVAEYDLSEDLEVYEMDYVDNKQFQEVCNIKQPVLFEFKSIEPSVFQDITIPSIGSITNDDIKIVDSNDYWKTLDTVDYITVPFQTAHKLMETDTNSHFFTEHNNIFMDENKLSSTLSTLDHYFKPYATIQTKTDFITGSKHCTLPLRYHTDYRHLVGVTNGKIHVKMTPWKSSKYLSPIKDYENYEFRSPINVWNPQQKYLHEMDKLKFLEFVVPVGHILFIPPYWWYSIKYSDEPDTCAFTCTYNTVINRLAHIKDIALYMLQQQNITKKITKTLNLINDENENNEIKSTVIPEQSVDQSSAIQPIESTDIEQLVDSTKVNQLIESTL